MLHIPRTASVTHFMLDDLRPPDFDNLEYGMSRKWDEVINLTGTLSCTHYGVHSVNASRHSIQAVYI
jgi:hypothetical protein